MPRIAPHSHPCQRCRVLTECCGDIEQNHDGWPEWVCIEFDTHDHSDFVCEDCAELVDHCDDEEADADCA